MKRKLSAHDEWMAARSYLQKAEQDAGISDALKELNDRNAHVATPEEHFDQQRGIVFDVADLELRRRVIHWWRECHRLCYAKEEETLSGLQDRVRDRGDKIRSSHLGGAIVMGVAFVLVGYAVLNLVGALAGTVVGVLVGFDHIRKADRRAADDVLQAEREIGEVRRFLDELGFDAVFSATEEATGLPDPAATPVKRPIW